MTTPLCELPLDLKQLTYGSRIETSVIEEACQVLVTDRRFDLEMLVFIEQLTEALRQAQGIEYDLVREKDTLVILTPEQMVAKITARRQAALRKIRKAIKKGQAAPREKLPTALQQKAEVELLRAGNILDFATRRSKETPTVAKTHKKPFA